MKEETRLGGILIDFSFLSKQLGTGHLKDRSVPSPTHGTGPVCDPVFTLDPAPSYTTPLELNTLPRYKDRVSQAK